MFDILELNADIEKKVGELNRLRTLSRVDRNLVSVPRVKLKILTTTSILKVRAICREISESIKGQNFFTSMALLRILLEQTIFLAFVLSKLSKKKSWQDADYLLTKASIGRRSRDEKEIADDKKPYNIVTSLEAAEEYISKEEPKLAGVFENTYTYISDFVHPNAPSHFYFWNHTESEIYFEEKIGIAHEDLGMILNHYAMSLKLFNLVTKRLNSIDY